jgi:hypothetical protein
MHLSEREKIKRFYKVRALLEPMDRFSQLKIVWGHLNYMIEKDRVNGIPWLLDRVGEVLKEAETALEKNKTL